MSDREALAAALRMLRESEEKVCALRPVVEAAQRWAAEYVAERGDVTRVKVETHRELAERAKGAGT